MKYYFHEKIEVGIFKLLLVQKSGIYVRPQRPKKLTERKKSTSIRCKKSSKRNSGIGSFDKQLQRVVGAY